MTHGAIPASATRNSILVLCGLLAALAVSAWLAVGGQAMPRTLPVDAPETAFSAARAQRDLEWIGAEFHPTGSAAAGRVRERLLARLSELGLQSAVQTGSAFVEYERGGTRTVHGGDVVNVVGVLPGRDRSARAVLLMAHYDSVPNSPGAADDGVGVAVMLEVARALRLQTRERDIVFLFTDAEEVGLLGARTFFAGHPLAERVEVAINLEARGSNGRAVLFETGRANEEVLRRYGRHVSLPLGNSLTGFVYRHMPNGSDFTIPAERGIAGLNFAIVGRQFDYHAATATPENIDPRSLQHMGATALALATDLAAGRALVGGGQDAVYSDLLGRAVLVWPAWSGWGLLVLAALSAGLGWWRMGQAHRITAGTVVAGVGASLLVFVVVALAMRLAFRLLGGGNPATLIDNRDLLATFEIFHAGAGVMAIAAMLATLWAVSGRKPAAVGAALLLLAGLCCSLRGGADVAGLMLGVVAAVLALSLRGAGAWRPGAVFGVLVSGLSVGLAVQLMAPALTPLLLWPAVLVAMSVALSACRRTVPRVLSVGIGVLAMAHVFHFANQLFAGVGYGLPEVLAIAAWLVVPLLLPWVPAVGAARTGMAAGAVALVAVVLLVGTKRVDIDDRRYPEISQVMYVAEPLRQHYWQASALPSLDAWSAGVLSEGGEAPARASFPVLHVGEVWRTRTQGATVALPEVTFVPASPGDEEILRIVPPKGARDLRLRIRSDAALQDVKLRGRPVPLLAGAGQWSQLRWQGSQGIDLRWTSDGRSRLELEVAAGSDGWPVEAAPLPPRPAGVVPWGISDMTWVMVNMQISSGRAAEGHAR